MCSQIDKMADRGHISRNEQIRRYIEKGLAVEGYSQDIDLIAGIIRQEVQAVYHIEDIKAVVEQQANRIAKMHMKSGKVDAAAFFLLVKVLMNVAHEGTEEQFDQMLSEAVALGVDYMQKKDFQINSFLADSGNLRRIADATLINAISRSVVQQRGLADGAKDPLSRQRAEKAADDGEKIIMQIDREGETVGLMSVSSCPSPRMKRLSRKCAVVRRAW